MSPLATTFFGFASEARRRKPDVAVLIDFPEFNLRLARKLKKAGIPVVYYVCPQLWAWRTYRVHQMARYVDKSLVILPFEVQFYRRYGVDASFVGNPILDTIGDPDDIKATLRRDLNVPDDHKLVGLLPGSRRKEVQRLAPVIAKAAGLIKARVPKVSFVLGRASKISEKKISKVLGPDHSCHICDDVYNVMKSCDLLLVASDRISIYDVANDGDTSGTRIAHRDNCSTSTDYNNTNVCFTLTADSPYDIAPGHHLMILFHWDGADHSDGAETIFLSGECWIPEPGSLSLLALGALALLQRRR